MRDRLIIASAAGGLIRAVAAVTTALTDEARIRHQTAPTATVALGRALTGAALLAASLHQQPGRITLRILGDGPLGAIVVDADPDGSVRGYLQNPQADLPLTDDGQFNIKGAVGSHGHLHVTSAHGASTTELVSGEIGGDLTHYLASSAQIPSAVMLGVYINQDESVRVAGGVIIQLNADAGEEIAERVENTLIHVPTFTELAGEGLNLENILQRVLDGFAVEVQTDIELRFSCRCSQAKVLDALAMIDPGQIRTMIEEDEGAEVTCHFCGNRYQLSRAQLEGLLDS